MTTDAAAAAVNLHRALLVAAAASLCLVLTELFHLGYGYMSVISVHIIMSNPATTIFQKGVERVLGRLLGVAFGLGLVMFLRETPLLFLLLLLLGMIVFFYIYYSGRLSYTGLQAGAFVTIVVMTGIASPAQALVLAAAMIQQIALGVAAALALTALTWLEESEMHAAGPPLLPLRLDWLNKSALLCTAMFATMGVTFYFSLPVIPSMISAAFLGMAPDPAARLHKARERARGAVLGSLFGFAGLVLLLQMPHFPLLVLLVFLGLFVASYGTRASTTASYTYLQMGLAIPMVLIGTTNELGTLTAGFQRILGVWAGLLASQTVDFLWPWPPAAQKAP